MIRINISNWFGLSAEVDYAMLNLAPAAVLVVGRTRRFAAALLPRLFGKNPRSHHKGTTGRVRTGDQRLPVQCHCQLGQDIPGLVIPHDDVGRPATHRPPDHPHRRCQVHSIRFLKDLNKVLQRNLLVNRTRFRVRLAVPGLPSWVKRLAKTCQFFNGLHCPVMMSCGAVNAGRGPLK